jgi:hypothetical protein
MSDPGLDTLGSDVIAVNQTVVVARGPLAVATLRRWLRASWQHRSTGVPVEAPNKYSLTGITVAGRASKIRNENKKPEAKL